MNSIGKKFLVKKELGLSLTALSKAVRKKLPRNTLSFDRVVISGIKSGENFQAEILTYRNAKNEILKRTIKKIKGLTNFFSVRNYQKTEKGHFIHINNFINNKLSSTSQETIALKQKKEQNIITRTKVNKKSLLGCSENTHSIEEFSNKNKPSFFKLRFFRNKKGIIKDVPFAIDMSLKKGVNIKLDDEFLPIYLNTNKTEIAKDLTQIYAKRLGFKESPTVKTFQKSLSGDGKIKVGSFCSWKEGKEELSLIFPQISFNIKDFKTGMIDTAAHETHHMKQFSRILDPDNINTLSENNMIKNFWNKIIKRNSKTKNEKEIQKLNAYLKSFGSSLTGKVITYEEYKNDILEIEAFKKGNKAIKVYGEF